jgi:DnaA-homolog protein
MSGPEQLALRLRGRSGASFANFVAVEANAATLHALQSWLRGPEFGIFFLFGAPGSGRSHLLQAACGELPAIYAPLAELHTQDPAILFEDFERMELICLDDIELVLADLHWCEQLFHLFNRLADKRRKLLISATQAAASVTCALPDLQSRLAWGGSFRLATLDDEGRQRALRLLASERGFALSDEVLTYLFAHYSRELGALVSLLDEIDKQSLARQKRITVPFVRQLLEHAGPGN